MSEKKVTVRLVMEGGKVVESELVGLGAKGKAALGGISTAANDVGRATGAMGGNVQNAAYQVQDFFVQVGSGTSVSRALGQQLPQLLGSFGLFGVLAGTAAAALIPLIGYLGGSADKAGDAKTALSNLSAELDAFNANADIAATKVEDLRKKYGQWAESIQATAQWMAQVNVGQAIDTLKEKTLTFSLALDGVAKAQDDAAEAAKRYFAALALQGKGAGDPQVMLDAYKSFNSTVDDLAKALGLTTTQAITLDQALNAVRGATTMQEIADNAAAALAVIKDLYPAGAVLPPVLAQAAAELQNVQAKAAQGLTTLNKVPLTVKDISAAVDAVRSSFNDATSAMLAMVNAQPGGDWLSTAIGRAGTLMAMLWDVNQAASAAQSTGGPTGVAPLRGPAGGAITDPTQAAFNVIPTVISGGRGGGASAQNDSLREAKRLFEETRTEAEKYASEQTKIDALLKSGAITADTYQRAIEMIGKKYGEAGEAGKFFGQIDADLKSAFVDLALTGENAFKKIADAIKRAALEAILFGDGPLGSVFGGKGGQGLLGGLFGTVLGGFGGGKATGGPVSAGMSYLVGERGPELFRPGAAGSIIPNRALQGGAAAGAMSITVNVSGARGNAEIEKMVASGVQQGIAAYDKHALPPRVKQIADDPRRRG